MKTKLFLALIAITGIANGQAPNWQWAKNGSGPGHDYANSISTDAYGNCYATGYFQLSPTAFGGDTLTGSGNYNSHFFIVKYDSTGNGKWAKTATGSSNSRGTCISTDANGNSYVTGYFQGAGSITFDSYTIMASNGGNFEGFLVKYDSSGTALWAKAVGLIGFASTTPVANSIDANGNVYVTGTFDATVSFIRKFDNAGNPVWQKNASGNYTVPSICTDATGNSYVTGCFQGASMTFGSTTITNSSAGQEIFVVKYDNSGNVMWAKGEGVYPSLYLPSISIDGNGNCYITGYFNGGYAQFGTILLPNAGWEDIFIVKFDGNGNIVWANRAGGISADEGHGIKTDVNGNSYITGMFRATAAFGNNYLSSVAGGPDIFVVKYDSAGTVLWAQQAGGSEPDVGNDISIDGSGMSYVAGHFFSPHAYFGSVACTNSDTITNPAEAFVAKMGDNLTGIEEGTMSREEMIIFPNPFYSEAALRMNTGLKNATLNMYNTLGEEVKNITNISGRTIMLQRDNLKAGIYFIRLTENNTIISAVKLIIADSNK